jgi:hypothetical protein
MPIDPVTAAIVTGVATDIGTKAVKESAKSISRKLNDVDEFAGEMWDDIAKMSVPEKAAIIPVAIVLGGTLTAIGTARGVAEGATEAVRKLFKD